VILLGWEIGTGKRVEIPETGHLAWFGQTQLSGKTTALEAIAFRGELRAVAFITKQGEGGFLTGKTIPPYFSEPTNDEEQPLWRWVKSILEASQQRKLNFEEAWIIRCCEDPRSAKTLKDVHENIKALLGGEGGYVEKGRGKKKKREWKYSRKPVSGINAGVYTSLKAYFDIVMPQLARLPYTKKLVLGPGLNVMDLREYAMETQSLVIRSVMEWVYLHEKGVRVIVPEAQDFVPQGKNSPVKMACETLVRKAGANKNFMWLDSQDMAAVDKIMLRACSIVGIGVQTEMHEIDRSLAGLFTPQLKPVDIARLKIGEFFVRTPEARVTKVYVQPAWMSSELHAQAIAKGEESVTGAKQMLNAFKKKLPPPPQLLQIQIQEFSDDDEKSESASSVDGEPTESDQSAYRTDRPGDTDGHVGAEINSGAVRGFGGRPFTEADKEKARKYGLGDPVLQPGDGYVYLENGRLKESLVGGDGVVRHFDHDTGLPWEENPHQEPGKHESETTQSGDPRIAGRNAGIENASEDEALPASVPGASVRLGHGEDRRESEGAMPEDQEKDTPLEFIEGALTGQYTIHSPTFISHLRRFLADYKALVEAHDALAARLRGESATAGKPAWPYFDPKAPREFSGIAEADKSAVAPGVGSEGGNGHGLRFTVPDLDYIYQYVKECAGKDPAILDLLVRRPELRIKVERQTVDMDDSTIIGRIARLLHDGWFKDPRNGPTVQKELKRRGCDQPTTNLYKPLNKLTEMGFLTLETDGYKEVPEMIVMVQKA